MSFSEYEDKKHIIELEISNNKIEEIQKIDVPVFRQLILFKNDFQNLLNNLKAFSPNSNLKSWCEIHITDKSSLTSEERELLFSETESKNIQLLAIKTLFKPEDWQTNENFEKLDELEIEEVFQKKCEAELLSEKEIETLKDSFKILLDDLEN